MIQFPSMNSAMEYLPTNNVKNNKLNKTIPTQFKNLEIILHSALQFLMISGNKSSQLSPKLIKMVILPSQEMNSASSSKLTILPKTSIQLLPKLMRMVIMLSNFGNSATQLIKKKHQDQTKDMTQNQFKLSQLTMITKATLMMSATISKTGFKAFLDHTPPSTTLMVTILLPTMNLDQASLMMTNLMKNFYLTIILLMLTLMELSLLMNSVTHTVMHSSQFMMKHTDMLMLMEHLKATVVPTLKMSEMQQFNTLPHLILTEMVLLHSVSSTQLLNTYSQKENGQLAIENSTHSI
jgi:hypothetical protein